MRLLLLLLLVSPPTACGDGVLPRLRRPSLVATGAEAAQPSIAVSARAAALERGSIGQPVTAAARKGWRRLLVAYLLWLCLPLTGAHHLYLGRNRAALLSNISLGGFTLGWALDFFRIPRYVAELDAAQAAEAAEKVEKSEKALTVGVSGAGSDHNQGDRDISAEAAMTGGCSSTSGAKLR